MSGAEHAAETASQPETPKTDLRAALESVREPTDEQAAAGLPHVGEPTLLENMKNAWRAMIDHLLAGV
ncbi:MAG: hypothetical protein KGL39_24140 [Patescibacteria group bacterium]|nr:hypothetical protein [Patescibacteria group bacterium]